MADVEFDPKELEAEPATPSKEVKAVVSVKQRKACHATLGKLIRAITDAGIYDEFTIALSQIAKRLKKI